MSAVNDGCHYSNRYRVQNNEVTRMPQSGTIVLRGSLLQETYPLLLNI